MEPHKIKAIIGVIALSLVVVIVIVVSVTLTTIQKQKQKGDKYQERAKKFLQKNILIDGHNDFLTNIRVNFHNRLSKHNKDIRDLSNWKNISSYTDINRLREGGVGGQYWGLSLNCSTSGKDALLTHLEQADLLRRMIKKNSKVFQFATTVKEIREAFKNKKIASIMTLEGGHAIDSSIAILRIYHELGVRSMTLALNCITPWIDDHSVNAKANLVDRGLTEFGEKIVMEMNRLGMVVDISHVSKQAMLDVLEISKAPVIFSHSSVYKICNHTRNVQDDVLRKLKEKNGVIMIDFYNGFVSCKNTSTIQDVIAHINYVKNQIGVEHIGLGGDYDVLPQKNITPEGLEDVSKYPNLIALLMKSGWTDEELKLLAGENLLRVMEANEKYAESVKSQLPIEDVIDKEEIIKVGLGACRTFL